MVWGCHRDQVADAVIEADFGLFDTAPLPETSAYPVALPALHDALEEEDVFDLDAPVEDADEDEEDRASDNEDEEE